MRVSCTTMSVPIWPQPARPMVTGLPAAARAFEFGNERGDACDHAFFMPFLRAARTFGFATSRRTGPTTESASPFFSSPGCLP